MPTAISAALRAAPRSSDAEATAAVAVADAYLVTDAHASSLASSQPSCLMARTNVERSSPGSRPFLPGRSGERRVISGSGVEANPPGNSGTEGDEVIFEHPESLRQRIEEITGHPAEARPRVLVDTSDFMAIDRGDVLRLAERDYLVLGTAREGRFGIDDQPKFWVKIAVDLTSGERKIIKLKFDEAFHSRIGEETYRDFDALLADLRAVFRPAEHA